MQKIIKIKGMSCGHCEGRVEKELEAVNGVDKAEASAEEETAVVEVSQEIEENKLQAAVEKAGYKYVGIS